MKRLIVFAGAILLLVGSRGPSQTKDDKAPPKKAAIEEILNLTPEKFIERFDKNKDSMLSKDEVPPFVAKGFEKFDANGDGMLNRDEVAVMLPVLRKLMAAAGKGPPLGKTADEIVENLLKTMDADMDGKISRKEAKGRLAEDFDKVDTNKDGYLDRKELRVLAERMLANQAKGPFGFGGPARPDFDSFDKNADGRLTPDELKGSPYAARFAEIDTDGNGYIDRREFESFLRKEAAKDKK
jgi:Ca2+-binding EF-hand superfamily protein